MKEGGSSEEDRVRPLVQNLGLELFLLWMGDFWPWLLEHGESPRHTPSFKRSRQGFCPYW